MVKYVELYGFSPTGGTRKVGETFAKALAEDVRYVDLLARDVQVLETNSDVDVIVAAVPVFAGRIPSVAREKLKTLKGNGKKAVALAVYGVRAYEDALLELVELLAECGFVVVGAGAFIAQHSMLGAVGEGRPDEKDCAELVAFAAKVEAKLAVEGSKTGVVAVDDGNVQVSVPGNHPYKEAMAVSNTPISSEGCVACGACERICPTEAIGITDGKVETELVKCIDCMACVAVCPLKVRCLKPAHQAGINERLGGLIGAYPTNEVYV